MASTTSTWHVISSPFKERRWATLKNDHTDKIPIRINNLDVDIVSSQKLLGTYLQQSCKWDINSLYLIKKARKRIYCLSVLKSYGVDKKILINTYKSIIESILANSITIWYSGLTTILRKKLNRVIKIASKIIGSKLPPLEELYHLRLHKKFQKIRSDRSHPANIYFMALPRRIRFKSFVGNDRFTNSFFPDCVRRRNSLARRGTRIGHEDK